MVWAGGGGVKSGGKGADSSETAFLAAHEGELRAYAAARAGSAAEKAIFDACLASRQAAGGTELKILYEAVEETKRKLRALQRDASFNTTTLGAEQLGSDLLTETQGASASPQPPSLSPGDAAAGASDDMLGSDA